jgi:hypothetical protein
MVVWGLIALVIAPHCALRLAFGALAQDPSYHLFADTRRCGPISHAGDVLTNLFILAAGIAGLSANRTRPSTGPRGEAAFTGPCTSVIVAATWKTAGFAGMER